MDKLIMEVFVNIDEEHIIELDSPIGHVTMIPFDGTVKGELFHGVIAPGGADTQVTNQNGVCHMSARYMLVGQDNTGRDCRIYVENNGWFTGDSNPGPFKTVPTFITDSKSLAPNLHTNQFRGEGHADENGLVIRFYEIHTRSD